ncbi:MAG: histidine phosphatase family protein [Alphaproteobacteria bacterium]|nr:histidine phosphatase family protein [Alphaproteobacteria bacterium]
MIVLARHGNTFGPGDKVVMVGAGTDLPLTPEGRAQAERVAAWLQRNGHVPARIIAGPLKRTMEFAQIIGIKYGYNVVTDRNLIELDYGAWEGRGDEDIKAAGGGKALEAWQKRGVWPAGAGWGESADMVRARAARALEACRGDATTFLCTSNGILRFIHAIATGEPPSDKAKVKTGHLCVLQPKGESSWHVVEWNSAP